MNNTTIAAIATPPGNAGIGIIRISGPKSLSIAQTLFRRKSFTPSDPHRLRLPSPLPPLTFHSHRLYHGYITPPTSDEIIDEVLLTFMKAPHSFTREDIVEIQSHSGFYILRTILDLVTENGARIAEPGEFTRRAFLNGRLDLTQAEAVIDLINAQTASSHSIAISQFSGKLHHEIHSARETLLTLLTHIQAAIDFPDDVEEILDVETLLSGIQLSVLSPLTRLLQRHKEAHSLRDGIKLAIIGAPNVGKSSLMNRIVNKERSIVTSIPGTTRDIIDEPLNLNGIPMIISDTAGIHKSFDPVESIGIAKARTQIESADILLLVFDVSAGITATDLNIYATLKTNCPTLILVANKSDLIAPPHPSPLPIEIKDHPLIQTSALLDTGIDCLKEAINRITVETLSRDTSTAVPNIRHSNALKVAIALSENIVAGLRESLPYELIAIDIQEAVDSLGEIIGIHTKIDVLDRIFSQFCIGK